MLDDIFDLCYRDEFEYYSFTMKKRLLPDQKRCVAERIMEWGNLVFVGLVISQAVSKDQFDFRIAILGIVSIVGAYYYAIRMMKGGNK